MKLVMVTIRDIKIGLYQPPYAVVAIGAAARAFQDACENEERNTDIARHPQDFELYKLGEYDQETGKFDLLPSPEFIMGGKNV
ncbi:MAG: nonstructural protein [Microviridae sp.]|nr:MAG: nonstructural protein [Microviridae sp.]